MESSRSTIVEIIEALLPGDNTEEGNTIYNSRNYWGSIADINAEDSVIQSTIVEIIEALLPLKPLL